MVSIQVHKYLGRIFNCSIHNYYKCHSTTNLFYHPLELTLLSSIVYMLLFHLYLYIKTFVIHPSLGQPSRKLSLKMATIIVLNNIILGVCYSFVYMYTQVMYPHSYTEIGE